MANEYKQGIDRVAVDESFPYPIKLEYDDDYIYLTPLSVPSNNYMLCLEVCSAVNRTIGHGHKHIFYNHGHHSYSGRFRAIIVQNQADDVKIDRSVWYNINGDTKCHESAYYRIGETVKCPISFIKNNDRSLKKLAHPYFKVRGTYRDDTDYHAPNKTTKIYSNIAYIET